MYVRHIIFHIMQAKHYVLNSTYRLPIDTNYIKISTGDKVFFLLKGPSSDRMKIDMWCVLAY